MHFQLPFVDPETKSPLDVSLASGNHILSSPSGEKYFEQNGIFNFIFPKSHGVFLKKSQDYHDARALEYEKNLHLTFKTHRLDETTCRNHFIDKLNLAPNFRVLEIACGTGRDSVLIADRINKGELHLVDISDGMMALCKQKLEHHDILTYSSLANVCNLPYPDEYFDAVYSFGGLGEFPDIKSTMAEIVRVSKIGAKVVVGDESIPPWLRSTYFYNVLVKTNPQFSSMVPLECMPIEARSLNLEYVINEAFYLIDFVVGKGEPSADFDFPIPGLRGGTYRTRFEGELEGVTQKTKQQVIDYCVRNKISIHDFLESSISAWLDTASQNTDSKKI